MVGIDANVLVRFIVRDDQRQGEAAKAAIGRAMAANEPLAVSLLTILETEWVLRSRYRFGKEVVVRTFKMLLETGDVLIEGEETLEQALYLFEDSSADFADCLMVARYQRMGCATMLTFDGNAAKLAGCELLA
ncbi:MAG: type II toxin-antitoxin system VapC family toxin [Sulfuricella sp.]|nr:type II toxin-antitoxin system VapC family toxin [Sulfuricella sp.]